MAPFRNFSSGKECLKRRSLQRRLSEESSSYQEVLTVTRRELADYYLSQSSASLVEIAYLLGFQDGNSFLRAFRGWTGQTPGEYRTSNMKDPHPLSEKSLIVKKINRADPIVLHRTYPVA